MDDPELQGDERILIRTQAVHVKSISFEAILTNKRIILVDRLKNVLPPKEIPLTTVQSIEPGENAIRELTIILGVVTKSGGTRQMVLTFSREGGGNRSKERDEWVRQIKASLTPSFEQVIRKVIPGMEPQQPMPERTVPERTPASVPTSRTAEFSPAPKKIVKTQPEPWQPPAPEPDTGSILGTYCTRCGTKVPEGSGFCTRCGAPITAAGEAPLAPPSAPFSPEPVTIPRGAAPAARPTPEVILPEFPVIGTPEPVIHEPAAIKASSPDVPPAKRHFIPKLFSPKDLPPTPLVPSSMPTAAPPLPKKPSNRKKILLVAGIIVIILIAVAAVVVVLPKLGSGGTHSSAGAGSVTPTTALPVTTVTTGAGATPTIVIATQTPASVPATGVAISVSYIGGFNGTYTAGGDTTPVTGSGSRVYEIGNVTGSVTAVFQKTDGTTTHPLTVGIYENGRQLSVSNTSAAYGKVTVTASA
ncbi:zinc-ribbon domain-containing protein [Methanoregula sp.]|uniref:zinc-ribbon domain-containing protein n=1 Tax=Methanoregula sp. TaxID=2052170 RepID=UPI002B751CD3|nr:zinc-ribbon domain-containing protein [Methanoregula sp.]HVP96338.1 zinc-ribbon domain-containing protein [Methanoregula sp.]